MKQALIAAYAMILILSGSAIAWIGAQDKPKDVPKQQSERQLFNSSGTSTYTLSTSAPSYFQISQSPNSEFSTGASLMFAPVSAPSPVSFIGYFEPWDRLVAFYVRSYERNPNDTEEILIALKISMRLPDGRTVGYSATKESGK